MDTPKDIAKLHEINPDATDDDQPNPSAQASKQHERKCSLSGVFNYARARPFHIPRQVSHSYPIFKGKQECALKIAVSDLEEQIMERTGITRLELVKDKLTVHLHNSQSKLSQQELQDLQKATHFDKKELQQWYKGTHTPVTVVGQEERAQMLTLNKAS